MNDQMDTSILRVSLLQSSVPNGHVTVLLATTKQAVRAVKPSEVQTDQHHRDMKDHRF